VTAAVLPSRGDHANLASSVDRPADRHRDSDCLIDFDIVRSGDDMPKMTNVVVSDDFNKITFTEGDQWRHELTLVSKYKATHVWRLGVNVPNGDRRRSVMPRIPGFQASFADRNCGDSQAAQQFSPDKDVSFRYTNSPFTRTTDWERLRDVVVSIFSIRRCRLAAVRRRRGSR
jgi:hypothetical protein